MEVHEPDRPYHTLNIIIGSLVGYGDSSSSIKIYSRQVMHIDRASLLKIMTPKINFSNKYVYENFPHDDPMVINLNIYDWNVSNLGGSYKFRRYPLLGWFQRIEDKPKLLKSFRVSLVGFSREQVHILGYVTLWTILWKQDIWCECFIPI